MYKIQDYITHFFGYKQNKANLLFRVHSFSTKI